jgi:hypothetical protein
MPNARFTVEQLRAMGYDEKGKRIERKTGINPVIPIPSSAQEQDIGNASERPDATEEADAPAMFAYPVRLHIHSIRKRCKGSDVDGLEPKWVIDAIVAAGILYDDNWTCIKEISFSQEPAGKRPEETVVTISEV